MTAPRKFAARPKIACVDFDGTVVEDRYPEIGPEVEGATETLRDLAGAGWRLILHTCRCDGNTAEGREHLREAVEWLAARGVRLWSVNASRLEDVEQYGVLFVPERHKPSADVYVDDRNLGGFPGWAAVRRVLLGGEPAALVVGRSPLAWRAAEALADEVAALVRRGALDARSPAADALLDFRDPPSSPRADRLASLGGRAARVMEFAADLEREAASLRELAAEAGDEVGGLCHLGDAHECGSERRRLSDKADLAEEWARRLRALLPEGA